MDFIVSSTQNGAAFLENETDKYLAINSGLKSRSFIGVDTSKLKSLPGLIIYNDDIKNWNLEGVTEIDSKMFYYGPYIKGKTLAELEMTPQILNELTSALYLIKDRKFPVHQFSLSSVFRTDDGKILFFPPHLMDFLNTHRLRKDSMKMIYPWNNPSLGGNSARAFTIATLAYKSITGEEPFPGTDEDEIEKCIGKKNYKSPLMSQPELKEKIVTLIDDSFEGKGDLSRWREVLEDWLIDGCLNKEINDFEKQKIIDNQNKIENKRVKKNVLSRFFESNRNKILAAVATLVVLGAIIQAPLSKALAPPETLGMTQKEVVAFYYESIKALDTEALEDCIVKKAGKGDINEVSTIYVTSKVRTSYEGSSGIIDPEQWILDGMNPVIPGVQIWGIAKLKIKQISTDTFQATYEKWSPAPVEDIDDNTPQMPKGHLITDIIHVSLIKEAWKIDELKRNVSNL